MPASIAFARIATSANAMWLDIQAKGALLLLLLPSLASALPVYGVRELGFTATAMNNRGQVVGFIGNQAVLWARALLSISTAGAKCSVRTGCGAPIQESLLQVSLMRAA
jgi:hypothetical protein